MSVRIIHIERGVALYASVNPKTNLIHLSYPISNFILVVDLISGSFRQQIFAESPESIAINHVTNNVYISSGEGIYNINGLTGDYQIIKEGSSSAHPGGSVDVNLVTNMVYTTCFGSDTVTAIDGTSGLVVEKISVGKNPQVVTVDSSSNRIYVADHGSETISVIDGNQSHIVIDTIPLAGFWSTKLAVRPTFILVNEVSKLLYVQATLMKGGYVEHAPVSWEVNILLVIDLVSRKKIKELKLDTVSRQGFGYNRSNNAIYTKTVHEDQKAIAKYDAYTEKVLDIIKLEPGTWKGTFGDSFFNEAVAINPIANKVYVSDSDKGVLYEMCG